jgi:hypothetical protein
MQLAGQRCHVITFRDGRLGNRFEGAHGHRWESEEVGRGMGKVGKNTVIDNDLSWHPIQMDMSTHCRPQEGATS